MRPRVIPAEVEQIMGHGKTRFGASMRPRVIPAEVDAVITAFRIVSPRFNEAAGHPRGSQVQYTADRTLIYQLQ